MVSPIATEIHVAENLCPTLFHTATVKPKRKGRSLLYRTTLTMKIVLITQTIKSLFGQNSD